MAELAVPSDSGDPLLQNEDFDSLIKEAIELLERKLPLEAIKLLNFARCKCSNRNQYILIIIHVSNSIRITGDLKRAKTTLTGAYNLMSKQAIDDIVGLDNLDACTVDENTVGLAALVNGLINAQLALPNPPRGNELLERSINNLIQAMMTLGPSYRDELVSCHVSLAKLLTLRGKNEDRNNAIDNLMAAYYLLNPNEDSKKSKKKFNIPDESLPFRYRLAP